MATCQLCNDRQATLKCKQCGKEICNPCAHKGAHGAFCGLNCAQAFSEHVGQQEAAAAGAPVKKGGGLFVKIIVLIVIAAAVIVVLMKLGILKTEDVEKRLNEGKRAVEKAAKDVQK